MYDVKLELKDAGLVNSSGYGTVDGEAAVVSVGEGLVKGRLIIDVSAIETADGNEEYYLHLMGGSDESFTNTVSLCALELGAAAVLAGNQTSGVGRYELPFTNEQNGIIYPFLRVRHVIDWPGDSGINYKAYLSKA